MKKTILITAILFLSLKLVGQDAAGTFTMKGPSIHYRIGVRPKNSSSSSDTNPQRAITIDSIKVYLVEGTIRKLYVYSGDSIRFTNKDVPISVTKFKKVKDLEILSEDDNKFKYIYVSDILSYKEEGEDMLIPDDVTFILKPGKETVQKAVDKSSRLAIDLRAYSDMLGVIDDQPNGLVQTEGSLKIITGTNNRIPNVPLYFIQYIQPYFGLAKFDSTYRQTNVAIDSSVNRMSMLQRNYFTFGVKVNVLKFYAKSGHSIEFNTGYQYNKTRLYNTLDSTKSTLSLNSLYFQLPIKIKFAKSIGFNYTPTLYFQKPEYLKSIEYIKNLSTNPVWQNEFYLYFNIAKDDKNNKVFIRFNMFKNLTEKGNNYEQLQIGYERSLSDLLNKLTF